MLGDPDGAGRHAEGGGRLLGRHPDGDPEGEDLPLLRRQGADEGHRPAGLVADQGRCSVPRRARRRRGRPRRPPARGSAGAGRQRPCGPRWRRRRPRTGVRGRHQVRRPVWTAIHTSCATSWATSSAPKRPSLARAYRNATTVHVPEEPRPHHHPRVGRERRGRATSVARPWCHRRSGPRRYRTVLTPGHGQAAGISVGRSGAVVETTALAQPMTQQRSPHPQALPDASVQRSNDTA